jgi:hypothetical protein
MRHSLHMSLKFRKEPSVAKFTFSRDDIRKGLNQIMKGVIDQQTWNEDR